MNLTVFGAAGGTGSLLVRAARAANHGVTAAVRNPAKMTTTDSRLRVVGADVRDRGTLGSAVDGCDAVLFAVGAAANEPTDLYSTGAANVLAAMADAGVKRFIGITARPVSPPDQASATERRLLFPIVGRFFGESYADMRRMEALLRASDADWTVVRPPRLTDRPGRGAYRSAVECYLPHARSLPRADLATAMLTLLDDPSSYRAAVAVAS